MDREHTDVIYLVHSEIFGYGDGNSFKLAVVIYIYFFCVRFSTHLWWWCTLHSRFHRIELTQLHMFGIATTLLAWITFVTSFFLQFWRSFERNFIPSWYLISFPIINRFVLKVSIVNLQLKDVIDVEKFKYRIIFNKDCYLPVIITTNATTIYLLLNLCMFYI